MRKLTTVLAGLLMISTLGWSQDTVRHLIISELRFDQWNWSYTELTNMGDTPVDLSEFTYACIRPLNSYLYEKIGDEIVQTSNNGFPQLGHSIDLAGILQPGDSYLIMPVYDVISETHGGRPIHSIDILQHADTVVHRPDWAKGDPLTATWPYKPEWEMWGFDSISKNQGVENRDVFMSRPNREAAGLYWHSGDTTSVLVDQALLKLAESGQREIAEVAVAGDMGACWDNTLVRKFIVKEGETDWTLSAGSDASSSEWMLIPHRDYHNYMGRTTEGNHGNWTMDFSSDVYDFDEANGTVTVPWGTEKHDSIRLGLDIGQGMAWWYFENASFEDSLSTVCKTGDTLRLYAVGNDLQVEAFVIEVSEPADDMADVFAKHAINWPDPEDDDYEPTDIPLVGGVPYWVKEYDDVIDSITQIGFATKVDSMMNNLEIAPNATWEIIWKSGEESNEVSDGDIFRVTAGDGTTTKDYYIQVEDYEMSDNVDLRAITWPDNPFPFLEGWSGDTIPGFIATGSSYKIILPPGTKAVPALRAETEDLNATLSVKRAVSLSGGIEQRTTTFTVTSESDTTIRDITVLFEVQLPEELKQNFSGEPIFSKFGMRVWWGSGNMELCNPTDELMDMSNYMVIKSNATNPADAIMERMGNDSTTWLNRYTKYVPGYKWVYWDQWQITPGVLTLDVAVDAYLDPGETMVFWKPHQSEGKGINDQVFLDEGRADVIMSSDSREPGVYWNPWGEPLGSGRYNEESVAMPHFPYSGNDAKSIFYLFKIKNDSVKAGLKAANDPLDYELIDVFGSADPGPWVVGGRETADNNNWYYRRNSDIFQGVTTLGAGFDDWLTTAHKYQAAEPLGHRDVFVKEFGQHTIDPITIHLSTVSSLLYMVDNGYQGDLGISGMGSGETVDQFIGGLILANADQGLTVYNGADGSMRAGGAAIVAGDSLVVISSDSTNSTTYTLSTVPLDDDAVLTVVDGSDLTIDIDGATGTIAGFQFGATIRSILDNVEVPDLAILNIIDGDDNLVNLQQLNNDTLYVDLVATEGYYFEVVAQNGNTIVYQLTPESTSSEAYVLSDIYVVTQDPGVIAQIEEGTGVQAFLDNVVPVKGATLMIQKVSGQSRETGVLSTDDRLIVTSEDETVTVAYELNFIGELAAYVTSLIEGVTVDQNTYVITCAEGTTVEGLVAALEAAEGASFHVEDDGENEKTTGTLEATDIVVVVSGDGLNSATYTLELVPTSVPEIGMGDLKIYPNPASSVLFVENLPTASTVRITDLLGRSSILLTDSEIAGGLDISDLDTGIYFLSVEKDGSIHKAVKFIIER